MLYFDRVLRLVFGKLSAPAGFILGREDIPRDGKLFISFFLTFFFLFFFVFVFFFICGLLVCTKCCWVCLCFAQPVSSCQDDFLCSQFEEEPVGLWMDGASSFLSHKRVKVCMCDGINCPSAGDLLNVSSNFFF